MEEARQHGMLCTPHNARPAPAIPDLAIIPLTCTSSVGEAKTFVTIQHRGFDFQDGEEASNQQAQQFLDDLHEGMAFLARLNGEPVGVGMYSTPMDGFTEIVGVATLPAFRRQGIGTAIIVEALHSAFSHGVEAVYLTASNEQAGQLYTHAGFTKYLTMLAYSD